MADNNWTVIDNKIKLMKDRNDRMDETAKLLQWDDNPYQLIRPDNTALKDAISVTPNLPKVFAHGVISDLLSGKWQTVIEGDISGTKARDAEKFIDDALAQADELLLSEHGIPSLFSWLCNHVSIRWAIGARCISQIVDNEYQIEIVPADMRWTPFVLGKWVAPITFWAKDELKEELEKYEKKAKDGGSEFNKVSLGETDIEVRDFWNSKVNELWVEKKLVFSQDNKLGYPPFVIVIPSSGFMLRDKGYLKHEGEDILFLNAGLYKEDARQLSLEITAGYAGIYPSYEVEKKTLTAEPAQPLPELDKTINVAEGERHVPVPRGDLNIAGRIGGTRIRDMLSEGGPLVPREYNQPPSAVLLAGETELISRQQNVRKEALGTFQSQLGRMIIDQFINVGKGEFAIGKKGKKTKYTASKLGNPDNYTISYHLTVKSKRQELANLAEFSAVYDKLPLEWNLTNILMADDPAGIMKDLDLEKAKRINPAITFLDLAVQYAREAEDTEDEDEKELLTQQSKILTHEYVMAMRQRIQSPTPTPQIEAPKGDGQLLAQFGGAAGAMRGEGTRERQEVV
jgi:hypothetical protein